VREAVQTAHPALVEDLETTTKELLQSLPRWAPLFQLLVKACAEPLAGQAQQRVASHPARTQMAS
jgi:hypothetical protein